jgi:hypothetical protein
MAFENPILTFQSMHDVVNGKIAFRVVILSVKSLSVVSPVECNLDVLAESILV